MKSLLSINFKMVAREQPESVVVPSQRKYSGTSLERASLNKNEDIAPQVSCYFVSPHCSISVWLLDRGCGHCTFDEGI